MSDVYVKWMKLKNASGDIKSYANSMNRIAEQVKTISSRLYLSEDVSYSIRAGLAKDVSQLQELSKKAGQYASALNTISELYSTTEERNIDR